MDELKYAIDYDIEYYKQKLEYTRDRRDACVDQVMYEILCTNCEVYEKLLSDCKKKKLKEQVMKFKECTIKSREDLKREYRDVKVHYDNLRKYIYELDDTYIEGDSLTPIEVLKEQLVIMDQYMKVLEHRAMRYERVNIIECCESK